VNRSIKRAAVLLTVLGVSCLPGTAIADPGAGQVMIFGNSNQVAGGDIFNAGHDNIVGSGDGTNAAPGLGVTLPPAEKVVAIRTGFETVHLLSHTGNATFAEDLPFQWTSVVTLSEHSTATYQGRDADYNIDVSLDASGNPQASCEPTTARGRCTIEFTGGLVVTMG
jgi:hypothetical protein